MDTDLLYSSFENSARQSAGGLRFTNFVCLRRAAQAYRVSSTHPDENYARESMQLFSIGLYELHANGPPLGCLAWLRVRDVCT